MACDAYQTMTPVKMRGQVGEGFRAYMQKWDASLRPPAPGWNTFWLSHCIYLTSSLNSKMENPCSRGGVNF